MKNKKLLRYIAIFILSIIFISGIIYIAKEFYIAYKEKDEYEELANFMQDNNSNDNNRTIQAQGSLDTSRIEKVTELYNQNNDVRAWIEIYGTNISYPVLQGKDDLYYLQHDYKKRSSARGSIVLDKDVDLEKPSSNFLIYGHRNKSNIMFENLYKYKDESFYKNHKKIRFTTLKEDMEFEVMAAFYSKSYIKEEKNVFKYYNFIDAKSEKDFENYVTNVRKQAIYDTNIEATYGDQLMTLYTCEYSQKNGRFVVVAKKI